MGLLALLAAVIAALACLPLRAQEASPESRADARLVGPVFEIRTLGGRVVRGPVGPLGPAGMQCNGVLVGLDELWFFHGPATSLQTSGQISVQLQSGEVLVGDVLGGDEDGEALTLRSKSFGTVEVALDEVSLLRVRGERGFPDRTRYATSEDSQDDTIFRETPLGFDPIRGVLESVEAKGLRFEVADGKSELFAWSRIAGLKLPDEPSKSDTSKKRLSFLMDDGSRVVGIPQKVVEKSAVLVLKHAKLGDLKLQLARVLAGHVEDPSTRIHVSTLEPTKVEERDLFSDRPLYPWRRDANVLGSALRVRRQYWTRGLGAHAKSVLEFEVPAGVKKLMTWIGADDTAVANRKVGDMRFRILRGEEVLADVESVKGGQAAQPIAPIQVEKGQRIRFEIDFGSALHTLDRGNWLAPVFVR